MAQVAMYGKMYGRSGAASVNGTIDSDQIDAAFALSASNDEDAKEDFMDALPSRISLLKWALLSAIVFNSERGVVAAQKRWKEVGKLGLAGEEFEVGIAPTQDGAKLEYVAVSE